MFLCLDFPICKTQRMILNFLCKLSNSCRARGRCCAPVALAWMCWYVGPHCGTREMQKNFIVAHCLFSMCWLYGCGRPGKPMAVPVSLAEKRKWRGWTSFLIYYCQKMWSLVILLASHRYAGLWRIIQVCFVCRLNLELMLLCYF